MRLSASTTTSESHIAGTTWSRFLATKATKTTKETKT